MNAPDQSSGREPRSDLVEPEGVNSGSSAGTIEPTGEEADPAQARAGGCPDHAEQQNRDRPDSGLVESPWATPQRSDAPSLSQSAEEQQVHRRDGAVDSPDPPTGKNRRQSVPERRRIMVNVGLLATVEAKPGKESEVEKFLTDAAGMAAQEPATTAWFSFRMNENTFGIVDFFPDDDGRQAHLSGPIAQALGEHAEELLAKEPAIQPIDVLGSKLPG